MIGGASFRYIRRFLFSVSLGLCGWSSAHAGTPQLMQLSPAGGQRGTTVEVDFVGRYIDGPQEVLVYEPGITAESIRSVFSRYPIASA